MKRIYVIVALLVLVASKRSSADVILTFDVQTDASTYVLGSTVNWSVILSITNSVATNFGLASATLDLRDSTLEVLDPGTIATNSFPGYSFFSGGTFETPTSKLLELTAVVFSQGSATFLDGDPSIDIPFASGSYTVNTLGAHTLEGTPGSTNEYFTSAGSFNGTGQQYTFAANNATFNVVAVPEPASTALFALGMVGWIVQSRKRRRMNLRKA